MKEANVTVVIPFFQGHTFIQRAVTSINNQTLAPLEIIIVDDGSQSPFQSSSLISRIPVRIIRHDVNRGIAASRNSGVDACNTEYVAFLDQDDEWLPAKNELQVPLLASGADVVVYGRGLRDGADGELLEWPRSNVMRALELSPQSALRQLMCHGNLIPFISVMLPVRALRSAGGFDESLRGGSDDYALMMALAASGFRFVGVRQPIVRRHETGFNYSAPLRFLKDDLAAVENVGASAAEARRFTRRAAAAAYYRAGRGMLESDQLVARKNLGEALRLHPIYPRAVVSWVAAYSPSAIRRGVSRLWNRARKFLYRPH